MMNDQLAGTVKRIIWLAAVVVVWGLLTACVGVTIETPAIDQYCSTFFCSNVYDPLDDLIFTWEPYPFPDDVNGSYRIYLSQLTESGEFIIKVSHHWDANPNGAAFVMGSFGYGEDVFIGSPSFIIVQPETYVQQLNPETGVYEYAYSPVQPSESWVKQNCVPIEEEYENWDMESGGITHYCGDDPVEAPSWILLAEGTLMQLSDSFYFGYVPEEYQ